MARLCTFVLPLSKNPRSRIGQIREVLLDDWTTRKPLAKADTPKVPASTAGGQSAKPEPPTPSDARTMRVDELPTATATPPKPSLPEKPLDKLPLRPAANAVTETAFDDELALVEAARTSLARGDAAACLSQLDRYEHRIRGGFFEREVRSVSASRSGL